MLPSMCKSLSKRSSWRLRRGNVRENKKLGTRIVRSGQQYARSLYGNSRSFGEGPLHLFAGKKQQNTLHTLRQCYVLSGVDDMKYQYCVFINASLVGVRQRLQVAREVGPRGQSSDTNSSSSSDEAE